MRGWFFILVFGFSLAVWAQNSSSNSSPNTSGADQKAPANQSTTDKPAVEKPETPRAPDLTPPHSDSINASALGDEPGESSSKDDPIDLTPPPTADAKAHLHSADAAGADGAPGDGDVAEFHPWDPHRASKDIEVGDFYFKRKNYRAAESRYREALLYKDNDATATFRLAVCLEKMDQPDDAREQYENYLKILPNGSEAVQARKALDRLKRASAKTGQ